MNPVAWLAYLFIGYILVYGAHEFLIFIEIV